MGSISFERLQKKYHGYSIKEIAKILADEDGYAVIVKYRSFGSQEYDNLGCCIREDEVEEYKSSCKDVKVVYDRRLESFFVNSDFILLGSCEICGQETTDESLNLHSGNDFYFCPNCGNMYCESCYRRLSLTIYPIGNGICEDCREPVQRAVINTFGNTKQGMQERRIEL